MEYKYSNCICQVMYGMTETSPVTFECFPSDPPEVRSSTIGYPSDHIEVSSRFYVLVITTDVFISISLMNYPWCLCTFNPWIHVFCHFFYMFSYSYFFHAQPLRQYFPHLQTMAIILIWQVKIADENGQVVPIGVAGEVCIRGYVNFLGYWGDPEKTKETVSQDRWLKTG